MKKSNVGGSREQGHCRRNVSGLHSDCNSVVPRRRAYPDADSQSNGYSYSDAETYAYTKAGADSEAASHSGAQTLIAAISES